MATRPDKLPRWATDETNNTEPDEAKKDTGFENGEKPIPSTDFNWLLNYHYQWLLFVTTRTRFVRPIFDAIDLDSKSWTSDGIVVTSGSLANAFFAIPAEEGDVISAIDVLVKGDGAVDANVTVVVFDDGMAETDLGTVLDSNRSAAWAFLNVPLSGGPYTVAAGEQLHIKVVPLNTGYQIAGIRITP